MYRYKKIISLISLSMLMSSNVVSKDYMSGKVQHLKWDDLEVVYLEDERFPTYQVGIYFADGALSDEQVKGVTSASFDFLSLGTNRFSRQDIASNLEFYGASYSAQVTHEYSMYKVGGLEKDIGQTMRKICHLFQDASYPVKDLNLEKKRILDSIANIGSNPQALASELSRELSLEGTPFSYPASGKKKDIKTWTSKMLKEKITYFNNQVKKKIYLTGPKSVLRIENIIKNNCGWRGQGKFERVVEYKIPTKRSRPQITLIPVPNSNQAQVRIGYFLSQDEIENSELMSLASHYLGGGFTSRLMRELRTESGLTYGVGAYAGGQKVYGRAGISTSTNAGDLPPCPKEQTEQAPHPDCGKNSLQALLDRTKRSIEEIVSGKIPDEELMRAKGSLAGSYPFGFESSKSYLSQLSYLDHIGEDYKTLFDFPEKVRSYSKEDVAQMTKDLFQWNKAQITIVGPKELKKVLEPYGDLVVKDYKNLL